MTSALLFALLAACSPVGVAVIEFPSTARLFTADVGLCAEIPLVVVLCAAEQPAAVAAQDSTPVTEEKSLGAARAEIDKKWQQIKSYTATVESVDTKSAVTWRGKLKALRDASGELLYRQDEEIVGDPPATLGKKAVASYSGNVLFRQREENGKIIVNKRIRSVNFGSGAVSMKAYYDEMCRTDIVTRLPDEEFDGKPVFVFEAVPKGPRRLAKVRHSVYKDSGIDARITSYKSSGEVMSETRILDVRVNVLVTPDEVKYAPPPDAVIEDRTNPSK